MNITPIVTPAEADVFLSAYADWLALSDAVKETHIYSASLYCQTQWTCLDVDGDPIDWTDTANIPIEIKHACSLFALADSVGNLYGDISEANTRRTTKELVKAGSVTIDEQFASSGSNEVGNYASHGFPNNLMAIYCTGAALGSRTLLRN